MKGSPQPTDQTIISRDGRNRRFCTYTAISAAVALSLGGISVLAKTDLALLKIDADSKLPYVAFGDSDSAQPGDWVVAIGNPFGLDGTATTGNIRQGT